MGNGRCEVSHGIPYGNPAYGHHRDEDEEDVVVVDADGIGVDDEAAAAFAHLHKAVTLLEPAEQQSQANAQQRAQGRYHAALEEEDALDLAVVGPQTAQGLHVLLLVDDEHGERADDVEAGHDEDEGKEDVGHDLLYLHDLEGVGLLFEAVEHLVLRPRYLPRLAFDGVEIAAVFQSQFE